MQSFKPPSQLYVVNKKSYTSLRIFLGGTIDMGDSDDWQSKIEQSLSIYDVNIFNPRRDDWDNSWTTSIGNHKFREQVEWELYNQENADILIYNILPDSKSPITLLEIGLFARSGKSVFVCCPSGFYRKGNIDVICARYSIPLYEDFDQLINDVKEILHN